MLQSKIKKISIKEDWQKLFYHFKNNKIFSIFLSLILFFINVVPG